MSTIHSRRSVSSRISRKSRRSSNKSHLSESRKRPVRKESVATIINSITLPKNLFNQKNITKDNKSHWEAASRKLRAIVPVFIQFNNQKVKKEMIKRERRRSVKSLFSRSSKSAEEVESDPGLLSPTNKTRSKLIKTPLQRRSSLFQGIVGGLKSAGDFFK
jgi:hypothetical protein